MQTSRPERTAIPDVETGAGAHPGHDGASMKPLPVFDDEAQRLAGEINRTLDYGALGQLLASEVFPYVFSEKAQRLLGKVHRKPDHDALSQLLAAEALPLIGRINRAKYAINLDYWLRRNAQRAVDLDLHHGKRRKILEIGTGGGYFSAVCQHLGHDVHATDKTLDDPIFAGVCAILGVKVSYLEIRPMEAMVLAEGVSGPFDLVAGYATCFNHYFDGSNRQWEGDEWRYFLDHALAAHLAPGAIVNFELNRNARGEDALDAEVAAVFRDKGGRIDGRKTLISYA